jgi:integrase
MSDDAFRTWLGDQNLSRTTVRKVATDLCTLRMRGPAPEAELQRRRTRDYRYAWALWADYCQESGVHNDLAEPVLEELPTHRRRRKGFEPKRLQDAVSIPLEQWRVFLAHVEQDPSRPARVIDVLCSSALRIGDVLRTTRDALDRGFRRADGMTRIEIKGERPVVYSIHGAGAEWERLRVNMKPGQLVCDYVSPKGHGDWTACGAAYQACRRKLDQLGTMAGIEDRLYLHRLRRTVAVQAALATGNNHLVQKILRHKSGKTTDDYLDETREGEVALALATMRQRMRG